MTLSQRWGRLFVAVCYAVRTPAPAPTVASSVRAGVDLGVRTLATVATIDTVTGEQTIIDYPNPAPLKATLVARRRAGRQLSRRIPGSHGHRAAKAKLSRLDRRCVHLRREAAHQLTTELAGRYGQIVVEDLDVAAMNAVWADGRFAGRSVMPQWVRSSRNWRTKPPVTARCSGWQIGGLLPVRSTTVASSRTACRAG